MLHVISLSGKTELLKCIDYFPKNRWARLSTFTYNGFICTNFRSQVQFQKRTRGKQQEYRPSLSSASLQQTGALLIRKVHMEAYVFLQGPMGSGAGHCLTCLTASGVASKTGGKMQLKSISRYVSALFLWPETFLQTLLETLLFCILHLIQFVSSFKQIWINVVALHHLLTDGYSAVNGCRQNKSPSS